MPDVGDIVKYLPEIFDIKEGFRRTEECGNSECTTKFNPISEDKPIRRGEEIRVIRKELERDIVLPIITEKPSLMILAASEEYTDIKEFIKEVFSRMKIKADSYFLAFSKDNGKGYFLYFVLVLENEKDLIKAMKECKKVISKFEGINAELRPFLKFGKRYVPEWFPDLKLVDDYLALLRRKRYFSYIDTLLRTMGTGIFPFARRLGEKDGAEVAKEHMEELSKFEREKGPSFLIDFVLRGIYYLRNFPQCRVREEGEEILVEILWKEWPEDWIKMGEHFLYGFMSGFLKEFKYGVEEVIEKGELVGLEVKKEGKRWRVRVKATRVPPRVRYFYFFTSIFKFLLDNFYLGD